MRNKKLFRTCMAGVLSAAMMVSALPVAAADFGDGTEVMDAVVAENPNLEEVPAQEVEASEVEEPVLEAPEEEVPEETEEPELFSAAASTRASELAISSKYFPDSKFRSYIQKNFDLDGNKALSTTEIQNVKEIDITGLGVAKLTGLSRFPYVTTLEASKNKLSGKLTLSSSNKRLQYIDLSNNKLTTLNLSSITSLKSLECQNNALTLVQMPKTCKNLEAVDVSHNKLTSQKNAGLSFISNAKYDEFYFIDASYNSIPSFNCSGFEGILDLSNNKITTLSGGSEGYQAAAIYLEGKYNTLSKTSKVDFSELGNRMPQRFTCNSSVRSKVVMVMPKVSASVASDWSKVKVTVGVSNSDATCTLYKNGKAVKTWQPGELDDPEFGENIYEDTAVKPGASYTYEVKASININDRNKKPVAWTRSAKKAVKLAPATPTSFSVKSSAKKTANLSWKAVSGASGYQVYYGTSTKKMKLAGSPTKTTAKKTGLTSGRTYYFKVRAYKTVGGKKYYGSFCSSKAVKIK